MLSHIDGFLDKMVQVLWESWGGSLNLQKSEDLASGDTLDLWDTEGISKNNTDLGRRRTSLGHLDDLLGQILSRNLNPAWWGLSVRKTSAGNTLSLGVHSTHCFYLIINNTFIAKNILKLNFIFINP